jgi:hypothetical protein
LGPGEEGGRLSELDNAVLDVIGRDSSSLNALPVNDIKPKFGKPTIECEGTLVNLDDIPFVLVNSNSSSSDGNSSLIYF